jgi:hypothetical protein
MHMHGWIRCTCMDGCYAHAWMDAMRMRRWMDAWADIATMYMDGWMAMYMEGWMAWHCVRGGMVGWLAGHSNYVHGWMDGT